MHDLLSEMYDGFGGTRQCIFHGSLGGVLSNRIPESSWIGTPMDKRSRTASWSRGHDATQEVSNYVLHGVDDK
jgi:hypothetical protein